MSRFVAMVSLFACGVGCMPATAPHAPIPPDAGKSPYYFPTRVGTKWVIGYRGEGHADDWGNVVIKSVEKDGRYIVTVKATGTDWVDDESTGYNRYVVTVDGVFDVTPGLSKVWDETDNPDLNTAFRILKLPHREGDKWKQWPGADSWCEMGAVETVTVPAGMFEAIRVDRKDEDAEYSFWYAPGVGMVKNQGKDSVLELKSFTLPKE